MATLSGYITEVRRLLHDANGNFYSDSELTDYINSARERVVRDTGCLRTLQSFTLTTNQESYSYASLPNGSNTLDVININVYWGNSRTPLRYLPWTDFNAQLRYWQNYIGLPIAFSIYGQNTIYFGPVPDQNYVCEFDTVILPNALQSDSTVEQLQDPYTVPVAYYAAHKAKFKEQSFGESEIFKQQYENQVRNVLSTVFTRRLPTPYSVPY
ncbi:MAG: hypothetical protein EB117_15605 [Betaproteobacteria bacterium]|nr:hypothetical protein [Betaproteobacteria bacterium]